MEVNTFVEEFGKIELPINGVKLPTFNPPESKRKELSLTDQSTNFDFLRKLCSKGFTALKLNKDSKEYQVYGDRVKYELSVIHDLGFTDYILLVWDVMNFCRESDIPVGLARGSAAGSLVLNLIGVTRIDPIKHELYFERFISKVRAKKQIIDGITYLDGKLMCDIDVDICYYNRGRVLKYLEDKFAGRISKILTITTLSGKLLIKECGKVVGNKSESEMKEVSEMIPKHFGTVEDIEVVYAGKKAKNGEWKEPPVEKFVAWCDDNKEVYEIALKLRDLIKNKGAHASGLVLSCDPLEETCPQELAYDKEEDKYYKVSSFTMDWVTLVNIKLDILGLRSVSVVDDICKRLNIKVEDINLDDPFIYKHYEELMTPHGLFQIEAETNLRITRKVKPKNLEQLTAVVSLGRPGALSFVDAYSDYANTGHVQLPDIESEAMKEILKQEGGSILYQETLMRIANQIFHLTLDEAELLRRACGKKKREDMEKFEARINEKGKELNIPKSAEFFWDILMSSADYSFNKSHAAAYASLCAITTYLKFKYPKEFYLSLLKMTKHEAASIKEITKIQKELHYFGIRLLPPHIVKSDMDFSIEGDDIRFGLLSIKGVSDKSMENINKFRNKYSNKFQIFQAAGEAGLGIGKLCSFIQAGALEGFEQPRCKVVLEAQAWNEMTEKEQKYVLQFGEQFKYDLTAIIKHLKVFNDEKGKPIMKESRHKTLVKDCKGYIAIYEQNRKDEKFANWFYERTLLGYSYSSKLVDIFKDQFSQLKEITEAKDTIDDTKVTFVGVVSELHEGVSKQNKNKYIRFEIEDESEKIRVMLFNTKRFASIDECKKLNGKLPEEKNIVIVHGTKKTDVIFANRIVIQDSRIFMRLADLGKKKDEKSLEEKPSST